MGYALTDGSVSMHFNGSMALVLASDKQHLDVISLHRQGTVYVRKNYFEGYLIGKLYGDYAYTFLDLQRTKCMHFAQKYLQMNHVIVIVFKFSHDVRSLVDLVIRWSYDISIFLQMHKIRHLPIPCCILWRDTSSPQLVETAGSLPGG
ncbi:hypothetical protein EDB85DRAFT_1964805 [Lactarius pseudohatsudake]|nr:hypothetical protein EDB85DRAFT_1964805 [Lactarius pseudohatsudake]